MNTVNQFSKIVRFSKDVREIDVSAKSLTVCGLGEHICVVDCADTGADTDGQFSLFYIC